MEMCARCHKRVAVVYVTKIENGTTVTEGICLKCARELGIKPVNDILEKMGVSPDNIDEIEDNLETFADAMQQPADGEDGLIPGESGDEEHGAPSINLGDLFGSFGLGKPPKASPLGDMMANPPQNAAKNPQNDSPKAGDASADRNEKNKEIKLKYLPIYCKNLTEAARKGELDRIVGRDHELSRVIQILSRRQKNNPCLIGEPGVGKTAIAEMLAIRISDGDIPRRLADKEIYLLDLTAIVAGTQFRGQFESRVHGLINEVKSLGNVILVIDEVHNIVAAGDAEGAMNAANILKPALSRGEIQVIGATTMKEYRKHIEKDAALERRFQPIVVNEPSIEEAGEILLGIKHYYEEFHGVKISDEVAKRAVVLSERYITDRFLPDKAIDIIDEAAAHVSLNNAAINDYEALSGELAETRAMIESLQEPGSSDMSDEDRYRELAKYRTEELRLAERTDEMKAALDSVEVTAEDLADVIEIWTGVPATSINESEFLRLDKLESRIKARIVGQDQAVDAVVRAIKRNRAGVSSKRKPVSFIFAGPTGVGKTELVKTIASDLFSSPDALIRVDMSEYMEQHSVAKIIGSPPGYVGYDEAGQLTEKIRRHPYSVVLLDEIEKAHPDVLNILLQILDEGKITDSHGRVVDFANTILVMTTNAGSSVGSSKVGFSGSEQASLAEARTQKSLTEFLRPEFINRVDEIITFRALEVEDFVRISSIMLAELRDALAEKKIRFAWSEEAAKLIAERSYSRTYGARNLRRLIQTEVEDKLANELIKRFEHRPELCALDVRDGAFVFDLV